MNAMTHWTLAARAAKMNPSVIREILKVTEKPGIISLAGGLPSPKTFPVDAFAKACEVVLGHDGARAHCSTPPARATARCARPLPNNCPGTWTRPRC
jgi:DNA-binding transcriptional MocR family regulator